MDSIADDLDTDESDTDFQILCLRCAARQEPVWPGCVPEDQPEGEPERQLECEPEGEPERQLE